MHCDPSNCEEGNRSRPKNKPDARGKRINPTLVPFSSGADRYRKLWQQTRLELKAYRYQAAGLLSRFGWVLSEGINCQDSPALIWQGTEPLILKRIKELAVINL
jgi:hypothetical protein